MKVGLNFLNFEEQKLLSALKWRQLLWSRKLSVSGERRWRRKLTNLLPRVSMSMPTSS